jgi:uncharacterized membrane protein
MSQMNKMALVTATAAVFVSLTATDVMAAKKNANASAEVKCQGINSCKGQSKCKTANSACAGQNSCKGQGWLPTASEQECTDKGGKVVSE